MPESWASANQRMACIDCGQSGAYPYKTTRGENPGRNVRVCVACAGEWAEFGLTDREPLHEEPGAKCPPHDPEILGTTHAVCKRCGAEKRLRHG